MKKLVAVAGNIGVGKSTLTQLLSDYLCWEPHLEAVTDNPYLADFYRDMRAWSFHSQTYFLIQRLYQQQRAAESLGSVVQDRTVYEDAEIFARNLRQQGMMAAEDWDRYWILYQITLQALPVPDLVVYLQASVPTLQERIRSRDRAFERQMTSTYLAQLNELYEIWAEGFNLCPVLTIPTDNLNVVASASELKIVANRVLEELCRR